MVLPHPLSESNFPINMLVEQQQRAVEFWARGKCSCNIRGESKEHIIIYFKQRMYQQQNVLISLGQSSPYRYCHLTYKHTECSIPVKLKTRQNTCLVLWSVISKGRIVVTQLFLVQTGCNFKQGYQSG